MNSNDTNEKRLFDMKILYIDIGTIGHHLPYVKSFANNPACDKVVILPNRIDGIDCEQIVFNQPIDLASRKFWGYLKVIRAIKSVADQHHVDIIHFLYGDALNRFFGFGLSMFRKYRLVASFHNLKKGFLHRLSAYLIFRKIKCGIVHTQFISDELLRLGIKNSKHIYYPVFDKEIQIPSKNEIRAALDLPKDVMILSAIGGTRVDKGLDILLEALKHVTGPFHLIIAGAEEYFKRDMIERSIETYKESVTICLHYLSKQALLEYIEASDAIVIPYRKIFNGASGPLTEGVWFRKTIIGPNHGGLGEMIEKHQLGLTFEAENTEDLTKVIQHYLTNGFAWNEGGENYRKNIVPEHFIAEHMRVYNAIEQQRPSKTNTKD